jgi:hypothetical protein
LQEKFGEEAMGDLISQLQELDVVKDAADDDLLPATELARFDRQLRYFSDIGPCPGIGWRRPMRPAIPIVIVALAAALLAGCGGSSSSNDGSRVLTRQLHTSLQHSGRGGNQASLSGASARSCDSGAVDAAGLRAVGVSCGRARQMMYSWQRERSCATPSGASRTSCSSRSYRCLGARTDRGVAVSCSRPGESVAFLAKRR